jgi:hypothetical protein
VRVDITDGHTSQQSTQRDGRHAAESSQAGGVARAGNDAARRRSPSRRCADCASGGSTCCSCTRIRPDTPLAEQLGMLRELRTEGRDRPKRTVRSRRRRTGGGTGDHRRRACADRRNLFDREHESVLTACEAGRIAFLPWRPVAWGTRGREQRAPPWRPRSTPSARRLHSRGIEGAPGTGAEGCPERALSARGGIGGPGRVLLAIRAGRAGSRRRAAG